MIAHDDIFQRFLIHDETTGNVLEVPAPSLNEPPTFKVVFNKADVRGEWFNLLRASGLMYQQLEMQAQHLAGLIQICDKCDAKVISEELKSMLDAIRLTQRCSTEGVETCSQKFN